MKFTFKDKQDYQDQRQALLAEVETLLGNGDVEGSNAKMSDVADMDKDFEDFGKAQANFNALNGTAKPQVNIFENGKVVDTMNNTISKADMINSIEYRTAFMRNVLAGEKIPAQFLNTDAQTVTSEVASVVPTVLVQKIYSKLENYGKFFSMATKTNYKGGVSVPTSSVSLTASWVAERSTADTQEVPTGTISFAYRKLICKVAVSFEVDNVTLDMFETDFVEKITKAMIKAVEQSMFTGNGSDGNQMVGFLTETPVSGQTVNITEGSHITYTNLCEAEGKVPEEYDTNAIWVMPKKTFYSEIVGMIDTDGQPIARVNVGIDGRPEHTILGRRVEFSPYMSAFATTVAGDTIVAAIFDFSSYVINTNYSMTIKKYIDEATDDVITKALMLVDGKTVDKNSLVTVTVKNS